MADLIDRQAAIKAIENLQDCYNGFSDTYDKACIIGVLEEVPSAQPERKTGKWIYNSPVTMKCNQCGLTIKDWNWHRFKYCPNCGARMEEEEDG